MATKNKLQEVLGADGNPLFPGGLWRRTSKDNGFKVYEDETGRKYWLNDGERDYTLPHVTVGKCTENGTVEIVYDSRCTPPPTGKA